MPHLELYPFRFRDRVTGKWLRARYKASLADLDQRYGAGRFEITGPSEIREVDTNARYFNPLRDERRSDASSIGNVAQILAVALHLGGDYRPLAVVGIAM